MMPSKIKYYIFVLMRLLRILAFPFSLVYALVVHLRNWCYVIGFFKSKSYRTPIVCIGNLSVGGTGKTPMVEYMITILKNEFKVAVLSRGYKRKSVGFVLASPESTVEDLGDEPLQIHSKFSSVVVAVDADRQHGIVQLESKVKPDVILLDDAFQHRKVNAGLNILLTSYGDLYCDDWYLPTGNLRDSKQEAKRAHFIVVTKCPPDLSQEERADITNKLKPLEHQRVLFSCLKYDSVLHHGHSTKPLDFFKDKPFTLVTGIAKPGPLVSYLKSEGLSFEHLAFKDHHFFTPKELRRLNSKQLIVTTEKDYTRLSDHVDDLYYIRIGHEFLSRQEELLKDALSDFMKRNS